MEWERGMGRIFPGGASSPALKVFFFPFSQHKLKK